MTTRTTPTPAVLLRLDPRDRAGLEWARNRARFWITALKRRRKHLPKGPYTAAEAETFQALLKLEETAGRLLETTDARPGKTTVYTD